MPFCWRWGFLVLTPLAILMTLSLNTGDPTVFPPEEYGVGNYGILRQNFRIVANTLQVSAFATVTAIVIGFLLAWILTRTRIRGSAMFQRMMELPYYMTPLVGALAWSILSPPPIRGFNQPGLERHRVPGEHHRHLHAAGHRLGDGAVRRHGGFRHDLGRDAVDGSRARGKLARAWRE